MEYEDFSIKIEPRQGDSYPVIVLRSPAGEGRAQFTLPFDPEKLAETASTLDKEVRTRRPANRDASTAMVSLPQRLGDQLFNALFSGVVRSLFDRSLGMMQVQQRGLRIKLHIDPEEPSLAPLQALPWEFLYRKETREFLNLSRFTPILRDLDVQRPYMPLKLQPPLRILVFSSDPVDYPRLDLEREQQQMEGCLGRLEGVQAEYLPHATLAALQERLVDGEYHVLHYMGHGGFDEESGRGVLLLEDEFQRAQRVDGGTLSVLLHDFSSLRLVFLNACETARLSSDKGLDPFAGVASALVMAGIPAVVAMQFPISDRAAITFAQRFYGLLSRGQPVDASVAEGRRALRMAEPDTLEWGTPVLFTSAPDGVIFTLATKPPAEKTVPPAYPTGEQIDAEQQKRLEKLYNDGLEAFWLEDWTRAAVSFQEVTALNPAFQDAQAKLEEALRRGELQALYAQAKAAAEAWNWTAAIAALEQLEKRQPGYQDVPARLQEARRASKLAELYDEARQLCANARWQAALKVFAQIQSLQPDYPDPDGLQARAQAEAEAQRKAAELEKHYQQALVELDAGRWVAAATLLEQVQAAQPDYRQVQALLARAQEEQRRQQAQLERQQAERDKEEKILLLYRQAREQLAAGKFATVQAQLQAIQALEPEFDDPLEVEAQARLGLERQAAEQQQQEQQAALKIQSDAQYAEALRLLKAGDAQAALAAWEALHALNPAYPDRQDLARKSLQALEEMAAKQRQEQQAVRKSQLDAQYAEAGRLLKAGDAQAALNSWEALHALDPAYPDRQDVVRKSRQALEQAASRQAEQDASTPAREGVRSRRLPRWAWWVGGGVALLAVLIGGLILLSSMGGQIGRIFQDIAGLVSPLAEDPSIYDNFNNPAYNGSYNPDLWKMAVGGQSVKAAQAEGVLVLEAREAGKEVSIFSAQTFDRPVSIQVRFFLQASAGNSAGINMHAGELYAGCNWWVSDSGIVQQCQGIESNFSPGKYLEAGWHTFKVDFYQYSENAILYYLDDEMIGREVFRDNRLNGRQIGIVLWLMPRPNWQPEYGAAKAQFDDVRVIPNP